MRFNIIAGFTAVFLTACSVHPLPEDVSKYDTYEIVRNIRCEARYEVWKILRHRLNNSESPVVQALKPDNVVRNIGLIWQHDKELAAKIERYRASAIGYDFSFDIQENNNVGISSTGGRGDANFRLPFSDGVFNWGVGAGLSQTRLAKREFKTEETFESLTNLYRFCRDLPTPVEKNTIYPLAGSVGMAKVIRTFIALGELGGAKDSLSDTLTFTTQADAGIGADVSLNPVSGRHRLLNAGLDLAASRRDIHKVVITLKFPDITEDEILKRQGLTPAERIAYAKQTRRAVRYERCVQRAEAREDAANTLRNQAPEYFCSLRTEDGIGSFSRQ